MLPATVDAWRTNLPKARGTTASCLPMTQEKEASVHSTGVNTAAHSRSQRRRCSHKRFEYGVYFWTLNGMKVRSGWTDPETEEAFLWLNVMPIIRYSTARLSAAAR